MTAEQIPLQFHQFEPLSLAQFIVGKNFDAICSIKSCIDTTTSKPLYLWGKTATGKSHLLQAACEYAANKGLKVAYVPLEIVIHHPVATLEGLEQQDLICIDGLELIRDQEQWQTALFHLYNRILEQSHTLIISSCESPLSIDIALADLKSRLSWGQSIHLEELGDDQKRELLQQRAEQRAFQLTDDVADFLLTRVDRNIKHLLAILDKIDRHSLAQQRKITIPFVKTILEDKTKLT